MNSLTKTVIFLIWWGTFLPYMAWCSSQWGTFLPYFAHIQWPWGTFLPYVAHTQVLWGTLLPYLARYEEPFYRIWPDYQETLVFLRISMIFIGCLLILLEKTKGNHRFSEIPRIFFFFLEDSLLVAGGSLQPACRQSTASLAPEAQVGEGLNEWSRTPRWSNRQKYNCWKNK